MLRLFFVRFQVCKQFFNISENYKFCYKMNLLKKNQLNSFKSFLIKNLFFLTSQIRTNLSSNVKIITGEQLHKHHKVLKQKQSYRSQAPKLIHSPIELNYLVPTNIFSQQVKIQEYPKIQVREKVENHFQNSYVSINLDVGHNTQLQNTLRGYSQNYIRIGRLLQIMDMIAGIVSYRHCFGSLKRHNPFTLVTGSVQSIYIFQQINCEQNIKVQGFVNHTGKTSMQIQINIYQSQILKLNSYFTMIGRNSKDLSKGYPVPKLNLSLLSQQQLRKAKSRQSLALQHINIRKLQISQSFDSLPPLQSEIKQIHQIFLQNKKTKMVEKQKIKISQTYTQTNLMMHLQDRNINGKIFGGFLMRQMTQVGQFAAKKFTNGNYFQIQGITDIYFLSPVQIGTGLTIGASITYNHHNIVIVTVQAKSINFTSGQKKSCCICQMILKTNQTTDIKKVYPDSYKEALKYLSSKRTYEKMFGHVSLTS